MKRTNILRTPNRKKIKIQVTQQCMICKQSPDFLFPLLCRDTICESCLDMLYTVNSLNNTGKKVCLGCTQCRKYTFVNSRDDLVRKYCCDFNAEDPTQPYQCKMHPYSEVHGYCTVCNYEPVCDDCISQKVHEGHLLTRPQDVFAELELKTQNIRQAAEKKKQTQQEYKTKILEEMDRVNFIIDQEIQRIRQIQDQCLAKLESRVKIFDKQLEASDALIQYCNKMTTVKEENEKEEIVKQIPILKSQLELLNIESTVSRESSAYVFQDINVLSLIQNIPVDDEDESDDETPDSEEVSKPEVIVIDDDSPTPAFQSSTYIPEGVLVTGSCDIGQQESPTFSVIQSLSNETIKFVAAGHECAFFVTEEGQLYAAGNNTSGQLGLFDQDGANSYSIPTRVEFFSQYKVERISCSYANHVICKAMKNGEKDSRVFVWGSNSLRQLGLPKDGDYEDYDDYYSSPQQLHFFDDDLVRNVYASGYEKTDNAYTCVLLENGNVFTMGTAKYGQMATKTNELVVPTQIKKLSNITDLALGPYHALSLDRDGTVREWGRSKHNSLCNTSICDEIQEAPRMIGALKGKGVTSVYAGKLMSAAIARIYFWGQKFGFKTKIEDDKYTKESRASPQLVELKGSIPQQIAMGFKHMVVRTESGHVFVQGKNGKHQIGTSDAYSLTKLSDYTDVRYVAAGYKMSILLSGD